MKINNLFVVAVVAAAALLIAKKNKKNTPAPITPPALPPAPSRPLIHPKDPHATAETYKPQKR